MKTITFISKAFVGFILLLIGMLSLILSISAIFMYYQYFNIAIVLVTVIVIHGGLVCIQMGHDIYKNLLP